LGNSYDKAKIEGDYIVGSYRSNLPKEGAYEVGRAAYEEMEERELAKARKEYEWVLKSYKQYIQNIDIDPKKRVGLVFL